MSLRQRPPHLVKGRLPAARTGGREESLRTRRVAEVSRCSGSRFYQGAQHSAHNGAVTIVPAAKLLHVPFGAQRRLEPVEFGRTFRVPHAGGGVVGSLRRCGSPRVGPVSFVAGTEPVRWLKKRVSPRRTAELRSTGVERSERLPPYHKESSTHALAGLLGITRATSLEVALRSARGRVGHNCRCPPCSPSAATARPRPS